MDLQEKVIEAIFLKRLNRFAALVEIEGQETLVHVTNSGRMRELLTPGTLVFLRFGKGTKRKTAYDLIMVLYQEKLVSVDSQLPNKLFFYSWQNGLLKSFLPYPQCFKEVCYGHSRLDFLLQNPTEKCLLEIKSVTLVEGGKALFPDAPTERGSRHLEELIRAKREGMRAIVLFIIQREDGKSFSPNDQMDQVFGDTLRKAYRAGAEVYAYNCCLTRESISLKDLVPVIL